MLKKILLAITCIFILGNTNISLAKDAPRQELKPLKLIHNTNYKYGDFEKNFKNTKNYTVEESRERSSILDVLNVILFIMTLLMISCAIFVKVNRINIEELLKGNFYKLKFNSNFKIATSQKLDNGKAIYLVEVGSKQLIIGTTPDEVKLLGQLDESTKVDDIPQEFVEKLFSDNNEEFKKLEE